jgi:hypothetical protein
MVPGVETFITACLENGIPMCKDNNSGNPVGVGLAQFNIGGGERSYAATAFLDPVRKTHKNLTVVTSTSVDRIVFDGKTARGVELYDNLTGERGTLSCLAARGCQLMWCSCGEIYGRGHLVRWNIRISQITAAVWRRTKGIIG